jgi:hypothetical protein
MRPRRKQPSENGHVAMVCRPMQSAAACRHTHGVHRETCIQRLRYPIPAPPIAIGHHNVIDDKVLGPLLSEVAMTSLLQCPQHPYQGQRSWWQRKTTNQPPEATNHQCRQVQLLCHPLHTVF